MNKGDKTLYQLGSFEPTLDPSYISLDNAFKGIVQRDLTGVETRLKQSVLLSYSVGKFFFEF
jgi:hypothetical protein